MRALITSARPSWIFVLIINESFNNFLSFALITIVTATSVMNRWEFSICRERIFHFLSFFLIIERIDVVSAHLSIQRIRDFTQIPAFQHLDFKSISSLNNCEIFSAINQREILATPQEISFKCSALGRGKKNTLIGISTSLFSHYTRITFHYFRCYFCDEKLKRRRGSCLYTLL